MNPNPGELFIRFLDAVVIAALVGFVVVWRYRRLIAQRMGTYSPTGNEVTLPAESARYLSRSEPPAAADSSARTNRHRLAGVATACGLLLTACLAAAHFSPTNFSVFGFVVVWMGISWPLLLVVALLVAAPRRAMLRTGLVLLAATSTVILLWSLVSSYGFGRTTVPLLTPLERFLRWSLGFSLPPLLLMLATGNPRLRAVGPMALAGSMAFGIAYILGSRVVVLVHDIQWVPAAFWQTADVDLLVIVFWAPLVGVLAWYLLRWLARLYQAKAFSDMQLISDSWYLALVILNAVELGTTSGMIGYAVVLAFPIYRALFEFWIRYLHLADRAPANRRLLLLRVFGESGKRRRSTERVFDEIAQGWRFRGSVQLIGGKDLASRMLNPGDLLGFIEGRVGDQFVRDGADLARRLREFDARPDPDGRYRVNGFYCFDDTWRPTLQALLAQSDVVLMDLRGFTRENSGCIFELAQIAAGGALGRAVLVTGPDTDQALLELTLVDALRDTPQPHAAPYVVRLEKDSATERARVIEALNHMPGNGERYPAPDLGTAER